MDKTIDFGEWANQLRLDSMKSKNEPIILVIQNGVASGSKITKESLCYVLDKQKMLGSEVERHIYKTKIKEQHG
jgi:hypothetical protein